MENEDRGRGLSRSQSACWAWDRPARKMPAVAVAVAGSRSAGGWAGRRAGKRSGAGSGQTLRPGEGSRGAPGGAVALRDCG